MIVTLLEVFMSLFDYGKMVCEETKKYNTDLNVFLERLGSKEFCLFNSDRMKEQLSKDNNSTAIDFFTCTVDISQKSMEKIVKSLSSKESVGHVLTKNLLKICGTEVGSVNNRITSSANRSTKGEGSESSKQRGSARPIYDRAFKFRIVGINGKSDNFYLYLSNSRGSGKGKTAMRFSFVPSKFESIELAIFFNRIAVVLGTRAYSRLMNKARFTRLDIKYDFKNVYPFAVFSGPTNINTDEMSIYPECNSTIRIVETNCLGNIKKSNSTVGYDKGLQLFAKGLISYEELCAAAPIYRNEYRNYPHRVKCPNQLSKIVNSACSGFNDPNFIRVNTGFDKVWFLNPKYLYILPKDLLIKLLTARKVSTVDYAAAMIRAKLGAGCKDVELVFSKEIDSNHVQMKIHELFNIALNPNCVLKQYDRTNYRTVVVRDRSSYAEKIVPERKATSVSKLKLSQENTVTAIIKSTSQVKIVQAGAGSGKTELCKKQLDYLHAQGVPMRYVAVCAFTDKAVNEFRGRCNKQDYINKIHLRTFSAFCSQAYNKLADYSKGVIEREGAVEVLDKLLEKYGLPPEIDAAEIHNLYSRYRNKGQSYASQLANAKKNSAVYLQCLGSIRSVLNDFERYKARKNLWEFDDMFPQFAKLLESDPDAARKFCGSFKYVIIDEVQDNNCHQWRIIEVMIKHGVNLLLVGDFAQAIFRFRGAEPEYLKHFEKRKYAEVTSLNGCHRSSCEIVELTNFLRYSIDPKLMPSVSLVGHGEKPVLYEADSAENCVKAIISDLKARMKSGLVAKKIFIIGRTHRTASSIGEAVKKLVPESVAKCINFDTCHGTKGKQTDICYVIDPRFSFYPWSERIEEESNLFVAVSRAKSALVIIRSLSGYCNYLGKSTGKHILDVLPDNLYTFKQY